MGITVSEKSISDQKYLGAALRLARRHQGLTGTNPSVACVIVADGEYGDVIVGSAVTARGGRPHAEPPALEEAGDLAKGATAYVTLEPCAHHGKTPPCAQALIDCGIGRVVTAIGDPDRRVDGQGHDMLRKAGVLVSQIDAGEQATRVLRGYLKSRIHAKPFVTLKLAMAENGMIGAKGTPNLKISGPESAAQTHLERARHDAILVGSGTAICDNPSLNCRLPGLAERSPTRVILDAKARLGEDNKVVQTAFSVPTIVVAPHTVPEDWKMMLAKNGCTFLPCEMHDGQIALPELIDDLHARGIQSIMVEGGAALATSMIEDQLIDELLIHVGGKPELPENGAEPIFAPFTVDTIPAEFELCQELTFGKDRSMRYRKKG